MQKEGALIFEDIVIGRAHDNIYNLYNCLTVRLIINRENPRKIPVLGEKIREPIRKRVK